jgi:hypothetical protein
MLGFCSNATDQDDQRSAPTAVGQCCDFMKSLLSQENSHRPVERRCLCDVMFCSAECREQGKINVEGAYEALMLILHEHAARI